MQENTIPKEENEQTTEAAQETSYSDLLDDEQLLGVLSGDTPTALDMRAIPEILAKKSVTALCRAKSSNYGSIILPLAQMYREDKKICFIVPSLRDAQYITRVADAYGLSSYVDADPEKEHAKPKGSFDDAFLVVGTPSSLLLTVQEKPVAYGAAILCGFESGGNSAPSQEINILLDSIDETEVSQKIWLSRSIPSSMNTLVEKYFVDGVQLDLEGEAAKRISHEYYELGQDLLAKPNAISDLMTVAGKPSTVIFCNSPADTDLLEVMLTKRGFLAKKLVGHVPDRALHGAVRKARNGELNVLIVTDVSARKLSAERFELVINHSAPEDPELYMQRIGEPSLDSSLSRVVSLVGATDLGNFHHLQKVVKLTFAQKELPTAEELESAHFAELILQAKRAEDEISSETKNLVNALLEHEQKDLLIALLLHNTTQVIPELRSNSRRGRGKNDRRGREDRDDYDSSPRSRKYDDEDKRERHPKVPAKKDTRIYLGQGTADSLTEEWLTKALNGGDEGAKFERITLRDKYGFVDFPEEVSEDVLEKLKDMELPSGDKVFACKATVISAPRSEQSEEEDSSSTSEEESTSEQAQEEQTEAAPAEESATA